MPESASAIVTATAWASSPCASEPRSRVAESSSLRVPAEERWFDLPYRRSERRRVPAAKSETVIAVMLVDDHLLVRRGFRRMLEDDPGIRVVAEAGDGPEAVELAMRVRPNVIVMDYALPSMNG